jgi:hypothetical protein
MRGARVGQECKRALSHRLRAAASETHFSVVKTPERQARFCDSDAPTAVRHTGSAIGHSLLAADGGVALHAEACP